MINLADYASLQAAIDAAPAGSVILIPPGHHTFTSVVINKPLTFRGEKAVTTNGSLWGDPGWGVDYWERDQGSVLVSDAVSGFAIDATQVPYAAIQLEDVMIRGATANSNAVIGVGLGSSGVFNANFRWQRVIIANFYTGIKCVECYDGAFDNLSIRGCDTGIIWQNCNALSVSYLQYLSGSVALLLQDATGNALNGGTIQGVTDTGIKLITAHETVVSNVYFENPGGNYAIYVQDGKRNEFLNCHLGTTGSKVYLGGTANYVKVADSHDGVITLAGQQNRVDYNRSDLTVLDPDGFWNTTSTLEDIGTNQSLVANVITTGGQRTGAIAYKNTDIVLQSPSGELFKIKVSDSGVLTTEAVT